MSIKINTTFNCFIAMIIVYIQSFINLKFIECIISADNNIYVKFKSIEDTKLYTKLLYNKKRIYYIYNKYAYMFTDFFNEENLLKGNTFLFLEMDSNDVENKGIKIDLVFNTTKNNLNLLSVSNSSFSNSNSNYLNAITLNYLGNNLFDAYDSKLNETNIMYDVYNTFPKNNELNSKSYKQKINEFELNDSIEDENNSNEINYNVKLKRAKFVRYNVEDGKFDNYNYLFVFYWEKLINYNQNFNLQNSNYSNNEDSSFRFWNATRQDVMCLISSMKISNNKYSAESNNIFDKNNTSSFENFYYNINNPSIYKRNYIYRSEIEKIKLSSGSNLKYLEKKFKFTNNHNWKKLKFYYKDLVYPFNIKNTEKFNISTIGLNLNNTKDIKNNNYSEVEYLSDGEWDVLPINHFYQALDYINTEGMQVYQICDGDKSPDVFMYTTFTGDNKILKGTTIILDTFDEYLIKNNGMFGGIMIGSRVMAESDIVYFNFLGTTNMINIENDTNKQSNNKNNNISYWNAFDGWCDPNDPKREINKDSYYLNKNIYPRNTNNNNNLSIEDIITKYNNLSNKDIDNVELLNSIETINTCSAWFKLSKESTGNNFNYFKNLWVFNWIKKIPEIKEIISDVVITELKDPYDWVKLPNWKTNNGEVGGAWGVSLPELNYGYHGKNYRAAESNFRDGSGLRTNTSEMYGFEKYSIYNILIINFLVTTAIIFIYIL